jgi:hypothetical protein
MTHAEIHIKAFDAINVLELRCKVEMQEYRERVKRLRGLMHGISVQRNKGEIDMLHESASLHPDLERLLIDPTHGL